MSYIQNLIIPSNTIFDNQKAKDSFSEFLVKITIFLIETTDYGLKLQLTEFMKTLLDNEFSNFFYENSLKIIAQLLSIDLPPDSKLQLNIDEESLVQS